MEKEACYAMSCVGFALANRTNSKVLRNIIIYEINKEVDREKSMRKKMDASRADTICRCKWLYGLIFSHWKIVVRIKLLFYQIFLLYGTSHAGFKSIWQRSSESLRIQIYSRSIQIQLRKYLISIPRGFYDKFCIESHTLRWFLKKNQIDKRNVYRDI